MDCSPGQKKGGRCREVVVILVEVRLPPGRDEQCSAIYTKLKECVHNLRLFTTLELSSFAQKSEDLG